jgi:hypothetical protein
MKLPPLTLKRSSYTQPLLGAALGAAAGGFGAPALVPNNADPAALKKRKLTAALAGALSGATLGGLGAHLVESNIDADNTLQSGMAALPEREHQQNYHDIAAVLQTLMTASNNDPVVVSHIAKVIPIIRAAAQKKQ